MTKQTPAYQSAQNDKRNAPHHAGHTYTKFKNNSLRRSSSNQGAPAHAKNLKFVSKTCSIASEPVFKKLDPSIPEEANRLQSRRRMIMYGKNTVGYDEYLRQVPKDKRKPRSLETPSTPDYTVDMPNKRWAGQVRAWRRALHSYDPPDLQTAFTRAAEEQQKVQATTTETKSVQELEVEQAKAAGLQVQFSSITEKPSPTSVMEASNDAFDELDQWEDKRNNDLDDFGSAGEDISDDSDDDLL